MLGRLKREFDFCCVDLVEEHELVLWQLEATVTMEAMPTAIFAHGVCSVNGSMYVLGGDGQDYLKRVLKYDTGSTAGVKWPGPGLRCNVCS